MLDSILFFKKTKSLIQLCVSFRFKFYHCFYDICRSLFFLVQRFTKLLELWLLNTFLYNDVVMPIIVLFIELYETMIRGTTLIIEGYFCLVSKSYLKLHDEKIRFFMVSDLTFKLISINTIIMLSAFTKQIQITVNVGLFLFITSFCCFFLVLVYTC